MKYNVMITHQAGRDLDEIHHYISFKLFQPSIAKGVIARIMDGIRSLSEFPERFKLYEKEPWGNRGLRQMGVEKFVVFYLADRMNLTVTIIRIFYSGRNIEDLLDQQ